MLDHGLEIVAYSAEAAAVPSAAHRRQPRRPGGTAEAWTAAVAYAALLHDIGKIAVDLHVELADGSIWHPGTARCASHTASATATIASTACTAPRQVCSTANCSTVILDWLSGYPSLWAPLLYVLAGQYEHAGTLGELVVQADQASVAQELGGDPAAAPWPRPSTRCSASCSTGCATCSRKS
jgi:hypothetical protein